MINEAWIKTKSQELDIPFSHILSAYVLETTVRIFAELADAKDFWLEDSDRLGLDVYKKSVSEKVRYYYTGGKAFKEIKERIRQDLLQAYEKEGFGVELVSEEKEGQGFRMNFSMEVCGMYVPFLVSLLPFGGEHIFPKEENLRLFLENNKTIGIYAYPVEQICFSTQFWNSLSEEDQGGASAVHRKAVGIVAGHGALPKTIRDPEQIPFGGTQGTGKFRGLVPQRPCKMQCLGMGKSERIRYIHLYGKEMEKPFA